MTTEPRSEFVGRRPAPALRPYLAGYVGYRESNLPPGRHRGLPSPYLTLILTLDDPLVVVAHPDPATPPGRYDSLLGGLHTTPALIAHPGRQSGIQLALSPLGARALLGLPAGELAHIDLDAGAVLGPFAEELRERLRSADGWAERFALLDRLLTDRLAPDTRLPAELVHAWRRLLASGGGVPVAELARETGWSSRYLSRSFGIEIGLSPKRAARVVRFDRARRLLQRPPVAGRPGGLAEVAAAAGYYDQAHLDRDFRAFAGCPPSRWLADEAGGGEGGGGFRNVQAEPGAGSADSAA
ncbi:AraC family transcriptional regulator [Plantactinospora mayteni]|uniref:AraC family transcriptional regulator n=1 Tax=Plantactinospora mayteni TaxID=566021 RepID=A0ABQ4EZS3_9ACTN|nr:helix-turn-helix domain-containing protein [Plantactinospora mayteni]GIH00174.1 AraC family transcriptional regulator [Plantactinospora mayteni]